MKSIFCILTVKNMKEYMQTIIMSLTVSARVFILKIRASLPASPVKKISPAILAAALAAFFPAWTQAAERNVFGEKSADGAALIGIFYDFKQTQKGEPAMVNGDDYWRVLDEFFANGWDETVLNRYFRVVKPLYSTQIFIPYSSAGAGPKAFDAGPRVQPTRWVIHYKGQVAPPSAGRWRFWGCADDILAVAVNGKMVLLSPFHQKPREAFRRVKWPENPATYAPGLKAPGGRLYSGDWLDLKADEIYDLDILIGERPGGEFFAFLMIEQEGATYEQTPDGPVLPIFQVAPYDTPVGRDTHEPRFTKNGSVWRCVQ
ncbi:MAG: hypothetical protein LBK60_08860 [Verrucomicrobiales bacterium]|jgi:hypothetical protein|nr:hypothetical protein [Verrucomicrobiales bacterium]